MNLPRRTARVLLGVLAMYVASAASAQTDTAPIFADGVTIPDQTYYVGERIADLYLPRATGGNPRAGGNARLSYALTPSVSTAIPGLRTSARLTSARLTEFRLFGTPSRVAEAVTLTYTARDADDDTATLIFSITVREPPVHISTTGLTVPEGETRIYSVALTSVPSGEVVITPSVAPMGHDLTLSRNGVSLLSGGAVSATAALTFTIGNWNSAQTVTVAATADSDDVADIATISHAVSGTGAYTTTPRMTVRIEPDTAPTFGSATIPDRTYYVGATTGILDLPEATGGNGDLSYTLTPNVPGLAFIDRVLFGSPFRGEADTVTLTYTVRDADGDTDTLTFSIATVERLVLVSPDVLLVTQGGTGTYRVRLAYDPDGEVVITPSVVPEGHGLTLSRNGVSLLSGGAVSAIAALTFTTDNWSSAQTVTVAAAEDSVVSGARIRHAISGISFPVITRSHAAVLFGDIPARQVFVTIDTEPEFAGAAPPDQTYFAGERITDLTLPRAIGGNGDLSYALAPDVPGLAFDSGTRVLSGTPPAVASAVTLTYTVRDEDGDTDTLTFSITVLAVPVRISTTRLTVPEGRARTYSVRLPSEPDGEVTVTPSVAPMGHDLTLSRNDVSLLSGGAVSATAALTFTSANWNSVQTVTVTAAADGDSTDDTATITHTASGASEYDGSAVAIDSVVVTVTDNDNDTPAVVLSQTTPLALNEGETREYTVVLRTEPTGSVMVTVTSSDAAVIVEPSPLIFTGGNWNITQRVIITAIQDDNGTNETVSITHTVSNYGSVTSADQDPIVVTVTDDDTPSVTISETSLSVDESGGVETYTVRLNTAPLGNATVTPTSNTAAALVSPSEPLTFTSANWNTAQTVTVTGGDIIGANDITGNITHAVSGYGNITTADAVAVTVRAAGIVLRDREGVEVTRLNLDEGNSITYYTVVLDTVPSANVTVTPLSSDAAVTVSGALVFTPANWNTAQTVDITATASATIRHEVSATGNYAGLVGPELRVIFGNAEAMDALNAVILPEVARVMVGHQVSAITNRINQARTPTGRAGAGLRANLGGHSTLEELAATHAQTMVDDGLDTKTLLGDSDFAMPLNAGDGGLGGSNLALWGSGDYRNIGGDNNNVDWDGSLFSAHLGVDVALQPGLLAGVMLAWSEADLEYTNRNTATAAATTGDYELDMTSLHPYVGWRALDGRLDMWTTVGYGSGDLKITEANATPTTADATLQTLGIGGSGTLLASRDTELRVKGEVQATRLEVGQAKDDAFNEMEVSATQTRLALEATRTLTAPNGAQILPSLELGMRHDGGDGATGNGLEIGAGLRYHNATRGLTLETRLRALLSHSGDTKDQGLSATLNLTPGADRQGLSLTLTPAYGNATSGVQNLWNKGVPTADSDSDLNARMSVEVGYGFAGFADGLLTPYSELTFDDNNKTYRMGMRWNLGKIFTLNLANERLEKDDAVAEDVYLLEGEVKF